MIQPEGPIRLDLNNPVFQEQLLTLKKAERHAALDTLNKFRQLTRNQLYRDPGIKREKITSIKPPAGSDAVYSLRISRSRTATAHREAEYLRFLTSATYHDATYGRN